MATWRMQVRGGAVRCGEVWGGAGSEVIGGSRQGEGDVGGCRMPVQHLLVNSYSAARARRYAAATLNTHTRLQPPWLGLVSSGLVLSQPPSGGPPHAVRPAGAAHCPKPSPARATHASALLAQRQGDGLANAARGTGHQAHGALGCGG